MKNTHEKGEFTPENLMDRLEKGIDDAFYELKKKAQQSKIMMDVQQHRLEEPLRKNVQKSIYPLYQDFNSWIAYIRQENDKRRRGIK